MLTVPQPSLYSCAAPIGHYWYQGLDYLFLQKCRWPQASVRFVLSKVCHTCSIPLMRMHLSWDAAMCWVL